MQRRSVILAALGQLAMAPGAAPAPALQRGATLAFGTTVSVAVAHADRAVGARAIEAALAAVRRVDRLMSVHHPDSEVFHLNRDGELACPDPQVVAVLLHARALSRLTHGAFDITVQPLWQACSHAFGHGRSPSAAQREQALALVGWQQVEANRARLALRRPGMRITLNGLAQGFAADQALRAVRAHGVAHALLDTGEFAALQGAGERPWRLGIPDPRVAGRFAAALAMDGRCVATSGDYGSAFTDDLVHHHIFDPATGYSPLALASVTVAAPTALEADGLSTAFMVMGARRAHTLAARLPGVDLLTIDKGGHAWRSPGFPQVPA